MSVIAEITVPANAFALEHTFTSVADLTVEVDRLATHSRDWVMPFVWVRGDLEAFEAAAEDDPTVSECRPVDVADPTGLYNVQWSARVTAVVDTIIDRHGIVLEAAATGGTWYLKLRFLDRTELEEFRSYFESEEYRFDVHRLYTENEPKRREFDLTPAQRETLVTALAVGYFEVPREAKIADLAEEFGISTNAVSQRLRRGTESLVRNTLTISPHGEAAEMATRAGRDGGGSG